jgi:hypothetical protein
MSTRLYTIYISTLIITLENRDFYVFLSKQHKLKPCYKNLYANHCYKGSYHLRITGIKVRNYLSSIMKGEIIQAIVHN